jgi:hypothetical protein
VSYLVWILGSLALFIWAVRVTCTRLPFCLLFIVISPAAVGNIFMGQSRFLTAALLVAGLRLAAVRPVVSGVLIGLLSFKPQLGILVPIALAVTGLWPAFITAGVTAATLALAASLAFGWNTWAAWWSMLPSYAALVDQVTHVWIMPTVIANLLLMGVPLAEAKAAQALAALTVAIVAARCFRRDPGPLAAALIVGVFLATPHAFFYDLPMLTAAIVMLIQARIDMTGRFSTFEIAVLVLATLFPIVMLLRNFPVPISAVSMLLLFAIIVRAQGRSRPTLARPAIIL